MLPTIDLHAFEQPGTSSSQMQWLSATVCNKKPLGNSANMML